MGKKGRAVIKEKAVRYCERIIIFSLLVTMFFFAPSNALISAGILSAIFFWLTKKVLTKEWKLPNTALNIPIFAFILVSILSMVNSINITESLIGLRKLVMYIFLYFVIVDNVINKRQFNWIILTVILAAGIVSLDGFFQFFSGKDLMRGRPLMLSGEKMLSGENIKRVTAAFKQASNLGIYLGALIPTVVSLTLYHFSGKKKLLIGLWGVIMLLCLALTLAPGAAFGFYAAMLFFIILKRDKRLLIVLIIGIILAWFILPSALINWPEGGLFGSIKGRIYMCRIAMRMIKIHPFLGMGLHTFPINYQRYVSPGYPYYGGIPPYAHNMYFHMAAEIGLIGLGVFIWLLVTLIRGWSSAYKKTESSYLKALSLGLLGGIIAFLTHGMLESSLYMTQGGILFWFMIGLSISLQRIIHAKLEK